MTTKERNEQFEQEAKRVKALHEYLGQFGLNRAQVALSLDHFADHYGQSGVESLFRFIEHAEKHNMDSLEIAATIGHDLSGAGTACFCPRTSRY